MKNFSSAMSAHLESGATTLVSCWLIARTDQVVLGFTDHDRALTVDGNSFLPASGMEASDVATRLGAQVDTSEIAGILSSSAINEDDIVLGRYRDALVTTYLVNWRDTSMFQIMRRDTIGEITREDGLFRAELRSPLQALNIPKGRFYQSVCDTWAGSSRCGVDLELAAFKGIATLSAVSARHTLKVTGLNSFSAGWFTFGQAVWQTGARAQLRDTIVGHETDGTTTTLQFSEPVGDTVKAGDTLNVYAGCNRLFSTCRDKFANGVNFQGFPHVPGNDFLLSYPQPGDRLAGGALIK